LGDFTPQTLLTSQSEKIEETLWVSLRMFEERKNLLNKMAAGETTRPLSRDKAGPRLFSVALADRTLRCPSLYPW
jgi:hypothetical protein